ncbi:MAG: response regulator [Pseudomonadota bacterium]
MDGSATTIARGTHQSGQCVYVVDDDRDIRQSLHFLLTGAALQPRVFAEPQDFLDAQPELLPGPILLDIRMAQMNGLQVLDQLNQREVNWPVIIMTAHGDVFTAVSAIKLGAMEFIEKPFGPDILTDALSQAFKALELSAPATRRKDEARQLFSQLSKRESEVLGLLVEGAANKHVAYYLGISIRTVEEHRSNALAKMRVRTVAEVALLVAAAEISPGTLLRDRAADVALRID